MNRLSESKHKKLRQAMQCLYDNKSMNVKELGDAINLSPYLRDKVIVALEFAGFIFNAEDGTAKIYKLSDDGIRLLKMMEE